MRSSQYANTLKQCSSCHVSPNCAAPLSNIIQQFRTLASCYLFFEPFYVINQHQLFELIGMPRMPLQKQRQSRTTGTKTEHINKTKRWRTKNQDSNRTQERNTDITQRDTWHVREQTARVQSGSRNGKQGKNGYSTELLCFSFLSSTLTSKPKVQHRVSRSSSLLWMVGTAPYRFTCHAQYIDLYVIHCCRCSRSLCRISGLVIDWVDCYSEPDTGNPH